MEAEDYPQTELNRQDEFLKKGIKLNDGCYIKAIPQRKKVLYIFQDPTGEEISKNYYDEPLLLTQQCTVGKDIKNHLNPENRFTAQIVREDFEGVKQALNQYYQTYQIREENLKKVEAEESEEELQAKMDEARALLECKDQPLIYIASLVSWLTAGERVNIMLAFMCYCSQVVLRDPWNVIALGEGASGKTHVEQVALKMIPEEFIINEKQVTAAAMFNRSKEKPDFYDGKIVDYGDLGGDKDQDEILAAKNLLKELQTEGDQGLIKPLSVPSDEGWVTVDIILKGKPCLTYTTVPNTFFDDQEQSRSIFITPRTDNRKTFTQMKKIIGLKGKTTKKQKYYESELQNIKYVVYLLRERMDSLQIINPYSHSVIEFLGNSEYFKRDIDKYNAILTIITAFHSYNREPFTIDGKEIIFTTKNDIQIFASLLAGYRASISGNITPKAAEILSDIESNFDEWLLQKKTFEQGITVNQYFELTDISLSKKSLQNYFGELNGAGFLKVVDHDGRANVYALSDHSPTALIENLLNLPESQEELIRYELGETALKFIKCDEPMDRLNIKLNDPDLEVPPWDMYDS